MDKGCNVEFAHEEKRGVVPKEGIFSKTSILAKSESVVSDLPVKERALASVQSSVTQPVSFGEIFAHLETALCLHSTARKWHHDFKGRN